MVFRKGIFDIGSVSETQWWFSHSGQWIISGKHVVLRSSYGLSGHQVFVRIDRQKNGKINALLQIFFAYATKIEPLRIAEKCVGFWFCKLASVSFHFERTDERNGVKNTSENNPNNFHRSIRACLYQAVAVFSSVSLLRNAILQYGGARLELPGRNYGNHGGTLRGGAYDGGDGCGALLQGYFQPLRPHLQEFQTHPARSSPHPFRRWNCWNHQTVSMLSSSKGV